jgi:hypothetical protein
MRSNGSGKAISVQIGMMMTISRPFDGSRPVRHDGLADKVKLFARHLAERALIPAGNPIGSLDERPGLQP